MTIERISAAVKTAAGQFPIKRAVLFGSQAEGTSTENSDIDLIIEFYEPVTLITISGLTQLLESLLGKSVDVIHGPLRSTDLLEIGKEIEVYAA